MKYYLSDGTVTESVTKYIKDLIYLNMLLLPDEIPYFSGGSDELIQDVLEDNLVSNIRMIVTNIITRITNSYPAVTISLGDVIVTGTTVKVNISINGITEIYEIKRFN